MSTAGLGIDTNADWYANTWHNLTSQIVTIARRHVTTNAACSRTLVREQGLVLIFSSAHRTVGQVVTRGPDMTAAAFAADDPVGTESGAATTLAQHRPADRRP
jgi:hypothetical protein